MGSAEILYLFSCGDHFQPVAVRVGDEVNTHGRIFVANAAHFLVELVGGIKVVGAKCQMELTLAQIIGLGMILQPGQLQLKAALGIAQVDDNKAVAVLRLTS